MELTEILLLLLAATVCIVACVTDAKHGVVHNKFLLTALIGSLILDAVYYGFFCTDIIVEFLMNIGVVCLIAAVLYFCHVWGGGDTKLTVVLALAAPARLYYYAGDELLPLLNFLVFAFSIGYIYLIGETVWLYLKNEDRQEKQLHGSDILAFLKSYIVCFLYMTLLSTGMQALFPAFYEQNSVLVLIINIALVLIICRVEIFFAWFSAVTAFIVTVALCIYTGIYPQISLYGVFILVALLLLRRLIAAFNYQSIDVMNLQPGMILSAATVLLMSASRVQDLPFDTSEDMRARLTPNQVAAVTRWSKTEKGSQSVTIVRKIPFALFLAIGFIIFIVLGILYDC